MMMGTIRTRPTIPSAIPDQQLVYSIAATVKDTIEDCVNAAPPKRDVPLDIV